eukprot:Hpha_TRINITY_DN31250_c0_g1::TRINITY_DN31250_c0_g1_i1::g.2344::m.2344
MTEKEAGPKIPPPGVRASLAETVPEWKDARVVCPDEDFEDAVKLLFSAADSGKAEDFKSAREALTALGGWKDLTRMRLTAKRLDERDEVLTARGDRALARQAAAVGRLNHLAGEVEALTKEWEEVKEIPVLCKELAAGASASELAKRTESALLEHEKAKVACEISKRNATEMRTSLSFILHKIGHAAALSERLTALASGRSADQPTPPEPKRRRV